MFFPEYEDFRHALNSWTQGIGTLNQVTERDNSPSPALWVWDRQTGQYTQHAPPLPPKRALGFAAERARG